MLSHAYFLHRTGKAVYEEKAQGYWPVNISDTTGMLQMPLSRRAKQSSWSLPNLETHSTERHWLTSTSIFYPFFVLQDYFCISCFQSFVSLPTIKGVPSDLLSSGNVCQYTLIFARNLKNSAKSRVLPETRNHIALETSDMTSIDSEWDPRYVLLKRRKQRQFTALYGLWGGVHTKDADLFLENLEKNCQLRWCDEELLAVVIRVCRVCDIFGLHGLQQNYGQVFAINVTVLYDNIHRNNDRISTVSYTIILCCF